jgi:hypothetical protein
MSVNISGFKQIRSIDNSHRFMPIMTTLLVIFLIWVAFWFFRGGSFRLYASIFFGLYYLTNQVWLSVLMIGIIQSIVFLPMRFVGMRLSQSFKDFEEELDKTKENEQYFMFTERVRKGDPTIVYYVFNFVINAIAFLSAGRIFLIDFYTQKLDPRYIYDFIPYPKYPLQGTDFHLPFFKITDTFSLGWNKIFLIWLSITLFFAALKLIWRFLKNFLSSNKKLLSVRINYNRLLMQIGGFGGTLLILSIIFLRNIPIKFLGWDLVADLTRQNTTMNFITAIATFITTVHAGYTRHRIDSEIAKRRGVPVDVINKVFKDKMRTSFKNALLLGAGAFFITNQIPCAFELSVAMFELLYILSPYTFDKILIRAGAGGWADQKVDKED